jgi:hypothetical protein
MMRGKLKDNIYYKPVHAAVVLPKVCQHMIRKNRLSRVSRTLNISNTFTFKIDRDMQ